MMTHILIPLFLLTLALPLQLLAGSNCSELFKSQSNELLIQTHRSGYGFFAYEEVGALIQGRGLGRFIEVRYRPLKWTTSQLSNGLSIEVPVFVTNEVSVVRGYLIDAMNHYGRLITEDGRVLTISGDIVSARILSYESFFDRPGVLKIPDSWDRVQLVSALFPNLRRVDLKGRAVVVAYIKNKRLEVIEGEILSQPLYGTPFTEWSIQVQRPTGTEQVSIQGDILEMRVKRN